MTVNGEERGAIHCLPSRRELLDEEKPGQKGGGWQMRWEPGGVGGWCRSDRGESWLLSERRELLSHSIFCGLACSSLFLLAQFLSLLAPIYFFHSS
jgi:hypothetical protein